MITQLHEVLTLERPLIGLDEETTGVDPRTSGIVELALEIMLPGKPVKEYRTLVNPMMPIPPEATKIHGITNDMVKDAPTFVQLADNLIRGFEGCDFAGYNVRFDLRQIAEEFRRAGKVWSYENARVIDAFRLWQVAEGRTLTHAVDRWLKSSRDINDVDVQSLDAEGQAHGALWDVKMSTRIVAAQLKACAHLPRDIQQLHDLCWPGWYDADGKIKRNNDGVLCLAFGEHRDKPLHLIPKGYLSWICGKDFSDKVKDACRQAIVKAK